MKKIIALISFVGCSLFAFSQIVNVNPDPLGDPYIAGDALSTPADIESLIPNMVLTPSSAAVLLPTVVDNSNSIHMPPIFDQEHSSCCTQAAEIWYMFTYEINRLRGLSSSLMENQYHPYFTYNFLNFGNNQGTYLTSGLITIEQCGVPSYDVYYDPILDNINAADAYKYWMNGHDKYKSGYENTISGIEYINWNVSPLPTPSFMPTAELLALPHERT